MTWSDASHATTWVRPFFFSVLSFVFHLPIFLVEQPDTFSQEDHKDAFGPITNSIFLSYQKVNTWLAFTRRCLNVIAFSLYYATLEKVAPAKTEAQSTSVYFSQTAYALGGNKAAGILLLVSLVLWIITYAYMRIHITRLALHHSVKVPHLFYYIVCIDPINWGLEIPGLGLPVTRYTCLLVRLANIIFGSIFIFAYICEKPIVDCWGCYQRGTNVYGLDEGVCASCPRLSAQDVIPPVCTKNEANCGLGAELWKDMLAYDIWVAEVVLSISFCVYVFYNCVRRLEYYDRVK